MKNLTNKISKMLVIVFTMSTVHLTNAQVNSNYVKSYSARESIKSGIKGVNDTERVSEGYQYYDGIGRKTQQIAIEASPDLSDIVSGLYYNGFGRPDTSYLPYTAVTNGIMQDKNTFLTDQKAFYSSNTDHVNDDHPFAVTIFERSPLSRPIEQGAPGSSWQPESGHAKRSEYGLNHAEEVRRLDFVNGNISTSETWWNAGVLTKTTTIDADSKVMIQFTNKLGQVILKRTILDEDHVDTHYIYDDKGNLARVIQPEGSKMLGTDALMSQILESFAFQYEYDERNRMISKKVPGAGEVLMVYDQLDRLILTQDALQRSEEKWYFTKYDHLNRPVMMGLLVDNASESDMRAAVLNQNQHEVTDVTRPFQYSNNAFPTGGNIKIHNVTYYDNYEFMSNEEWNALNDGFNDPEDILVLNQQVRGQVTGTAIRSMEGNYVRSVSYYDRKYRPIQTQSTNHLFGRDILTSYYDFIGQVEKTIRTHDNGGETTTITKTFDYDRAGRLKEIWHQINDQDPVQISTNDYNELGELAEKNLHGTEQSLDYTYNIRGWLKSINDPGLTDGEGDLFGMELVYDESDGETSNKPAFNGNISAMKWSDYNHHVANTRSYAYTYDDLNRLLTADHFINGSATTKFDVDNIDYDLNGNIESLRRFDRSGSHLDDLTYEYGAEGNRLQYVKDASDNAEGFDDGESLNTLASPDYKYDANGNMTSDLNKSIASIQYYRSNLPQRVEFENGDYLLYYYDAVGNKLRKKAYKAGETEPYKTTDYVGEFIYENNELHLIQHEEGRIIPIRDDSDASITSFDYQYHLKDHLGNTRLTFKTTPESYTTVETMESDGNGESASPSDFVGIPYHTNAGANTTAGGDEVATLEAGEAGAMVFICVNKGDTLDLSVKANYESTASSFDLVSLLSDALFSMYNTGMTSKSLESVTGTQNHINDALGDMVAGAGSKDSQGDAPMAYINYIYFDEDMNYHKAGFTQISTVAQGPGVHELVTLDLGAMEINGYVMAYLSNESQQTVSVNFDDFTIKHAKTNVVQSDDYYPFGGTFNSYTSGTENLYKYQGYELQKETETYLTEFRTYDPWLGRWGQVDPKANEFHSPYTGMGNNPLLYVDPRGDTIFVNNTGYITRNDETDNLVYTTNDDGELVSLGEIGGEINADGIYANLLEENTKEAEGMWSPFSFKNKVKNKGDWDLKNNKKTIFGLANHTKGEKTTFSFQGESMEAQDIGNHHFGAVGEAFGLFSQDFMLEQAGKAQIAAGTSRPEWQKYEESYVPSSTGGVTLIRKSLPPYGDDPRDQKWIKSGFNYYQRRKK